MSTIQDDLYDYTTRVRRTIAEVLADFRHLRIPREYVFDVFPPLRPREFSIASSIEVRGFPLHRCNARSEIEVIGEGNR